MLFALPAVLLVVGFLAYVLGRADERRRYLGRRGGMLR
jgi:hypothetical protein